jgi:hypothetical protein
MADSIAVACSSMVGCMQKLGNTCQPLPIVLVEMCTIASLEQALLDQLHNRVG